MVETRLNMKALEAAFDATSWDGSQNEAVEKGIRTYLAHCSPNSPDAEAAFPGVTGFGASFNRELDGWELYAMPGVMPFGFIKGFNPVRLDWTVGCLRAALSTETE